MQATKIKVIGVGGSGCNAITRMKKCNLRGVELVAVNSDAQDLEEAKADTKIRIGRELTQGLGTGMDPSVGRDAALEQKEELEEAVEDADLVFVTCGQGGGTGTGASPVIAKAAKENGALTVAVVTKPFSFEGAQRKKTATKGLKKLKKQVDTLVVIPNDKITELSDEELELDEAFWMADEVLRQAVSGISELIVGSGIVNVDFADIKTIMEDSGRALFGMGKAEGELRAKKAVEDALNSPFLGWSIEGAEGALFSVSGQNIALTEIDKIASTLSDKLSSDARLIFGAIEDNDLKKKELKVTLIATGFE